MTYAIVPTKSSLLRRVSHVNRPIVTSLVDVVNAVFWSSNIRSKIEQSRDDEIKFSRLKFECWNLDK